MKRALPFSIFWLLALIALLAWAFMSPSFFATLEINRGVLLLTASELGSSNHEQESQATRASTHFERALEAQPTDWRADVGLGMLALRKDDDDEPQAIRYWQEALKHAKEAQLPTRLGQDIALEYWLGMAYRANGQDEQALQRWRKAQVASKFTKDGDYLRKADQLDAARASYELALAVNPDAQEAKKGLEKVLRQLIRRLKDKGEQKEAFSLLKEVINLSPRANDFVQLGDHERQMGALRQAREWYERGAALYAQDAAISHRLGLLALQEGEVDKAEGLFRRAISLDPDYIYAYNVLARSLLQQGRLEEAKEIALEGLQREPDNPSLYARLGDVYKRQTHINEAKVAYEQALELYAKGMISPEMEYVEKQLQEIESAEGLIGE